jgi:hypothetical protein
LNQIDADLKTLFMGPDPKSPLELTGLPFTDLELPSPSLVLLCRYFFFGIGGGV